MTASCPGFSTYRVLADGQVEVNGQLPTFAEGSGSEIKLVEAWDEFKGPVSAASQRYGIPAPWLMGIMVQESGGNPEACSPCSICRSSLCESGAGRQCCAFGLMQFIGPTAREYGTTPTEIIQNPGMAIEVAAELLSDFRDRFGFDLVRMAAAYNGGPGVLSKCGKAGTTFGWNTNDNYPMEVVKYSNTAFALGMLQAEPQWIVGGVIAAVGLGVAYAMFAGWV